MGSGGPSGVTVHVTGFKKFHGVSENPTETIINNLREYMQKKGLPKDLDPGSCTVLETAGRGHLPSFTKYWSLLWLVRTMNLQTPGQVLWLHFGVNSGATRFALETQAVNEASFRCPMS